jgi:uncharacterized protein (TIRG00374 family)
VGLRRAWPVLRYVLGLGMAVLAFWVLLGHRSELQEIGQAFDTFRWWWIPPALAVELASYVALAKVQYRMLEVGGVRPGFTPILALTTAFQSITNSMPAGSAFAAVYGYRWFRRLGADERLSVWALAGAVVAVAISLALLAAAGVALATELGESLDLIPVIVGVLVVTVAIGALFVYDRPLVFLVQVFLRWSRRLTGRPRGELAESIQVVLRWLTVARLTWRDMGNVVGWGLLNWLLDCGCFAMSFLAIGSAIPWKGLLLAYGAGQLAATLPITPGGLGAVEGSITVALVAFGGDRTASVDAVLVYRLLSFWLMLVIGWLCFAAMAWTVRQGRYPREVGSSQSLGPSREPRVTGKNATTDVAVSR